MGCLHQETASLVLEGKDKVISITGQKEAPWGDVITFRGDAITYRFIAETDGKVGAANSLGTSDPQEDDWGFRFTVSDLYFLVLETVNPQYALNEHVYTGSVRSVAESVNALLACSLAVCS